jgi:DNA-directed RNA polymerase subunit RPC12/RpoP
MRPIECPKCGSTRIYVQSQGHSDLMFDFKYAVRCVDCGTEITDPFVIRRVLND